MQSTEILRKTRINIVFSIFLQKYLVMSKKSSTFAVAFGNKGIYGGYSSVGRASDCGSECRGFEPHYPPKKERYTFWYVALFLYCLLSLLLRFRIVLCIFLCFYLRLYLFPCFFSVWGEGGVNDGFFSQFGLDELELLVQVMHA